MLLKNVLNSTLVLGLAASLHGSGERLEISVSDLAGLDRAQAILDSGFPNEACHIAIQLAPGDYTLDRAFRIARSNVSLTGTPGTILKLDDQANEPVIAIGVQTEITRPEDTVSNISIQGLAIDGNMDNQSSETTAALPWIRNNGIDIRAASQISIRDVSAYACRSGGLVVSWDSSDIRVERCAFDRNYFDGIALYAAKEIHVSDTSMTANRSAGVSIDNALVDSSFTDCRILKNQNVGIFIRNAENIRFDRCEIRGSRDWAAFLAHDDHELGVRRIAFDECVIVANNGGVRMASIHEAQSSGTRVTRTRFSNNDRHGRANLDSAGSPILATANTHSPTSGTPFHLGVIR